MIIDCNFNDEEIEECICKVASDSYIFERFKNYNKPFVGTWNNYGFILKTRFIFSRYQYEFKGKYIKENNMINKIEIKFPILMSNHMFGKSEYWERIFRNMFRQ